MGMPEMIKDFEMVKQQLQELSTVVNAFKSEAVQLKVVELLFQRIGIETVKQERSAGDSDGAKKSTRARKKRNKADTTAESKPKAARSGRGGRPGPGAMVSQLVKDGFFAKPKTVQDIIDHCRAKFAYTYAPNEMAVTMTRALRNQTLKREKNSDNQFEYVAK
jgi:hypothetical protein